MALFEKNNYLLLALGSSLCSVTHSYAGQVNSFSDSTGDLPIHLASEKAKNVKTFNSLRLLLKEGAPLNVPNKKGELPIHIIVKRLNLKTNDTKEALFFITSLLMSGSPVNIPDQSGDLPIHIFLEKLNETLKGALSDQQEFSWKEVLHGLLERGSSLKVPNKAGELPIDILVHYQGIDFYMEHRKYFIKMLLQAGSPLSKWEHEQPELIGPVPEQSPQAS